MDMLSMGKIRPYIKQDLFSEEYVFPSLTEVYGYINYMTATSEDTEYFIKEMWGIMKLTG